LFVSARAQNDSLNRSDSVVIRTDSALERKNSLLVPDSSIANKNDTIKALVPQIAYKRFDTALYSNHPYYKFDDPIRFIVSDKKWEGKELFFYLMLGLLIFFAIIKNTFNRYLNDLSKLFFRTSIKHRQVKDQLMQAPMPSLLLNILFVLTGALFINLVLQHYKLGTSYNFWQLLLLCALALTAIYLVKFITLKICGWLFRLRHATDAYIFIVFTTNKIIGIVLLPLLILLAFTKGSFNEVVLTLSLVVVGALFLYRFFLSYVSIHKEVKIQLFHFLLYLCAFEIIPLLLINKLLFHFLS
jgi:hypothetical protein